VSGAWWMRPKRAVGKGKPPRTPGLRAGVEAAHEHVAEAVDVRLRGLVQVALDVELAPAGDGAVHVVEVGRQRRRPEDDALPPRLDGGARARPAAVEARGPLEDGPVVGRPVRVVEQDRVPARWVRPRARRASAPRAAAALRVLGEEAALLEEAAHGPDGLVDVGAGAPLGVLLVGLAVEAQVLEQEDDARARAAPRRKVVVHGRLVGRRRAVDGEDAAHHVLEVRVRLRRRVVVRRAGDGEQRREHDAPHRRGRAACPDRGEVCNVGAPYTRMESSS